MAQPRIVEVRDDLVVVDKPSGMRVHPADADGALDLCRWLGERDDLPAGLVPVHRIDAGTSGAVLCAATPTSRTRLAGWFADGKVKKTYLALVVGRARKKGVVRRPLRDPRRKRSLDAVTRWWRVESLGGFSLVRVVPETGRRHQIRRHLHGIGLPVVGDERYRPRRFVPVPGFPGRLWLHAHRLALPEGSEVVVELPDELADHLELLRRGPAGG